MAGALLVLICLGILSIAGVSMFKARDQKQQDRERTTYELTFPRDLDHARIVDNMRVDLYIDLALPAIGKRRRYYVEVQEHARSDLIKQKLSAHWAAFTTHTGAYYPEVAFVARDDYLKFRLTRLIPAHQRELFTVYTAAEFLAKATAQ